jgi:hypothetical protein
MRQLFFLVLTTFAVSFTAFGQNKITKTKRQDPITESLVLQKLEKLKTSMLQADSTEWKNLVADNFIFTGAKGEFSETSKNKVLDWFKSGTVKFTLYKTDDVKVKIFNNTAIVTSVESLEGIASGESFNAHVRSTMIWVKQKKLLQLVAQQRTTTP